MLLIVLGLLGYITRFEKVVSNHSSLLIIISDPYSYGIGERVARISTLSLDSQYQNVIVLSGRKANLKDVRKMIANLDKFPFDIIIFAHSNKHGFHLLRDTENKDVLISPVEIGKAIASPNLRYFYTSGCNGAAGLQQLKSVSGAEFVVGHRGISMIPALPFFALEFFGFINKGEAPEKAKNLAWEKINSNWIFKNILIRLNEFNTGEKFSNSEPVSF